MAINILLKLRHSQIYYAPQYGLIEYVLCLQNLIYIKPDEIQVRPYKNYEPHAALD